MLVLDGLPVASSTKPRPGRRGFVFGYLPFEINQA
jgi:hypothetical protein